MRSIIINYLRGDLRRNRAVTLVLVAVLTLSAVLVTGGAMVLERSAGAVERLFIDAKPPHFLQMHQGAYDERALNEFAAAHPEIDSWLIEDMVGFDGVSVSWSARDGRHGDLSESLIDNLFVSQNTEFDFLLDESGGIPRPSDGQIYLPVAYATQFELAPGDSITVSTDNGPQTFVVMGAVRDAQMASSMASSTRFLISDGDLAELSNAGGGTPEVIIEFRLTDTADTSALQRAYEADPKLPHNGQAVTEVMIRLVNIMSDGLAAIALMFAGLLLVAISLLTVRFIIRGSIEEEVREIGALKAIGIPDRSIARLFLGRYAAVTLVACIVGGVLAIPLASSLTEGLEVNFGAPESSWLTVAVPLAALVALFLIVVGICARMLRVIRKSTVIQTLIHGSTSRAKRSANPRSGDAALGLRTGRSLVRRLTLVDLRAERGGWALLPIVYFLTATLITIPFALLGTFLNPQFAAQLGVRPADIRADVQFGDGQQSMLASKQQLLDAFAADPRIEGASAFGVTRYFIDGEEGPETLRVEVGDYTDSGIAFVEGAAPASGEVALSALNAAKFGVGVGDVVTLTHKETASDLRVSGIYQDVTSGGYTAKIAGAAPDDSDRWVVYADVAPGHDPSAVAADYQGELPATTVVPVEEYMSQTLSYVTAALRSVSIAMLVIAVVSVCLIAAAFLHLRLLKDRRKIGTLTVLGFTRREQTGQFRLKTLVGVVTGVLLGVLFALTGGQRLVGAAMASTGIGVTQLHFIPQFLLTYVVVPGLLVATGAVLATALARQFLKKNPIEWIRS